MGGPEKANRGREQWRIVRGRVWLAYCLFVSKATPYQFAVDYLADDFAFSKLIFKWAKETSSPSRSSALRVAGLPSKRHQKPSKSLPDSIWLFDAMSLLRPDIRSGRRITLLINNRSCQLISGKWKWSFPDGACSESITNNRYDTRALEDRSDIWGFLAIICLMREAELMRHSKAHVELFKASHRILSAGLKPEWASAFESDIKSLLSPLRGRVLLTAVTLDGEGREA